MALNNGGQIPIPVRKLNFDFSDMKSKKYFRNNTILSAWGAALSGTFPPGEKEFIESVRLYQDRITDDQLRQNIKDFIGQEGQHSHQHRQANVVLTEQLGWDAKFVEEHLAKSIKKRTKYFRSDSDKWRLAITVCAEHMTAIMAEFMLNHSEIFDGLDKRPRDLLLWHAVEEIEHKAVAFDTFMTVENDRKFLRKAMRVTTALFLWDQIYYPTRLLWRAKKIPNFKEVKEYFTFMSKVTRNLNKPYKDFYREDFHPWDHQNQELVEKWKVEFYRADMEKNPV